jgi:hypothetical protein
VGSAVSHRRARGTNGVAKPTKLATPSINHLNTKSSQFFRTSITNILFLFTRICGITRRQNVSKGNQNSSPNTDQVGDRSDTLHCFPDHHDPHSSGASWVLATVLASSCPLLLNGTGLWITPFHWKNKQPVTHQLYPELAVVRDGTVIMLSGFMISESLLPFMGISLPRNFAWRSLHDLSANLFLVVLGLHTALHWSWIVESFKRYIFQPIGRIFSSRSGKDITA